VNSDEKSTEPGGPDYGLLGMILLAAGALICTLATAESIGGLPFDMPRSWYLHRGLWIAMGIAALGAGFLIQRPPKGDERDTT